jgi:transposase
MEATGYARWFERLLAELGIELWIGDPAEIAAQRVKKRKTDREDARLLLRLMREDRFPKIWVPSPENRDLRQLLWHRHRMVQMRTRNRPKVYTKRNGLYRRPGSPFFWMAFVDQHGKLVRQSTKRRLKTDAQAELDKVRVARADGTLVAGARKLTFGRSVPPPELTARSSGSTNARAAAAIPAECRVSAPGPPQPRHQAPWRSRLA